MYRKYMLSYSPILENVSGDLAVGDVALLEDEEGVVGMFPSSEEAVTAWVCKMGHQDVDLVELRRRRGFGLVYSACPRDGSVSFLYNVEVQEYGVASTNEYSAD